MHHIEFSFGLFPKNKIIGKTILYISVALLNDVFEIVNFENLMQTQYLFVSLVLSEWLAHVYL